MFQYHCVLSNWKDKQNEIFLKYFLEKDQEKMLILDDLSQEKILLEFIYKNNVDS